MEHQYPQQQRTNGMAVTCLVLSVLSLATCGGLAILPLAAIILGAVALGQIGASNGRQGGSTLAIIGLALSLMAFMMIPIQAAILFPVFAKAREKARQAACASNQMQLALGLLQYASDYDDHLPTPRVAWQPATEPYVAGAPVYTCPADTDGPPSYQFSTMLRGKVLSKLTAPAETVMLFETDDNKTVVWRHNDGANYGYADGHIKWQSKATTPQGYGGP